MHIEENADLKAHSTMRLGGRAKWLAEARSEGEVIELANWARSRNLPAIMISDGSNIVWRDEGYDGLVIVNRILGKDVLKETTSDTIVKIGAGEDWDEVV